MALDFIDAPHAADLKSIVPNSPNKVIVWWYCGIGRAKRVKSQPRILINYREIKNNIVLEKANIFKYAPIDYLGALKIGSVWENGRRVSIAKHETRDFDVCFDEDSWKFVSSYDSYHSGKTIPFPTKIYETEYNPDKNILLHFNLTNNGKLIIPCLEFFSAMYGVSDNLKRFLATYQSDKCDEIFFKPLGRPSTPGVWEFVRGNRLKRGDNIFLAHYKYDEHTKCAAKSIYAQIESKFLSSDTTIIFPKISPWFTGKTKLRVRGIPFNENRSFLGLEIVGYIHPNGPPIRVFKKRRDGGLSVEGDNKNKISRVDYIYPPDAVEIVDDSEANQGGSIADIKNSGITIVNPGRIVDEVYDDNIPFGDGSRYYDDTKSEMFSAGEPQGSGGDIGLSLSHSPIILKSEGKVRDIWNAAQFLLETKKGIIESVHWYTFKDGHVSNLDPKYISLDRFTSKDKVDGDVKNWVHINKNKMSRTRGALIIRICAYGVPVYIVEIERRLIKGVNENGEEVLKEEDMTGGVFILQNQDDLDVWLRTLLSEIRHRKGKFRQIEAYCPGKYNFFKHTLKSVNQSVSGELSIKNALRKVDVELGR